MLNTIIVSVALLSAFVWVLIINSKKKKLLNAVIGELKVVDSLFSPVNKEEDKLQSLKEQYSSLQS